MKIYVFFGTWLILWVICWWIAKNKYKVKQPIGTGWLASMFFLVVIFYTAQFLLKKPEAEASMTVAEPQPTEPANTAVVEKAALSMTPSIHTDPKMALTYATQRLADLKADYARNEALYQNKDIQGLRDIRGELIDAMNVDEYKPPSEMRFFMGCYEAYHEIVPINFYYIGDSIYQDGHDAEQVAEHKEKYEYWLGLCEENIQSSLEP